MRHEGSRIRVNGQSYEIMYTQEEADPAPGRTPPVRKYVGIYLHNLKTRSPEPTHMIKFYLDSNEAFMLDLCCRRPVETRVDGFELEG
jgi:hypothetical protein